MKRVLIFWGFLAVLCTGMFAAGPNNLFARANQAYEQGDYSAALRQYREISRSITHWKIFYNMGNCHYKAGEWVKAKIFYLRARRLRPHDPDIRNNLNLVEKKFNNEKKTEPGFLETFYLDVSGRISVNLVSMLLVLSILLLNVFFFVLIRKKKNRWIIYGLLFSGAFALLLSAYHIHRVYLWETHDKGVITRENARLLSGPAADQTVLYNLNPGLEVKVLDTRGEWIQVTASGDIGGWIRANALELI